MGLALVTLLLALAAGLVARRPPAGIRRHRAGWSRTPRGPAGRGPAAGLPLAGSHLLVSAFVVQLVEPLASRAVPGAYPIALAVSATLMTQFMARNILTPGVALAGVGLLLNAAVVLVNGAMPVSSAATAYAGVPVERLDLGADPRHEELSSTTPLPWLADVVPVPLPWRPEVSSVGDLLLAAGIGLLAVSSILDGAAVKGAAQRAPGRATSNPPRVGRTHTRFPAGAAQERRADAVSQPNLPPGRHRR